VLLSDKANISEHLHYTTYYTPELAELVSMRDRQMILIEMFGYVFEQASSLRNSGPQPSFEKPTALYMSSRFEKPPWGN
jgi:hypothetical protein